VKELPQLFGKLKIFFGFFPRVDYYIIFKKAKQQEKGDRQFLEKNACPLAFPFNKEGGS
jgi:hypothetical protein